MQRTDQKTKIILIYQQKFLLSLFLNHNLKSTIFFNKNENFPIIDFLRILLKKYNVFIKKLKYYSSINKNSCYPYF